MNKGYATGCFTIENNRISTAQKWHHIESYDHDVVSDISEWQREMYQDGFVSNIKDSITIHIKESKMGDINNIKRVFRLTDDMEISIEPFLGWDYYFPETSSKKRNKEK